MDKRSGKQKWGICAKCSSDPPGLVSWQNPTPTCWSKATTLNCWSKGAWGAAPLTRQLCGWQEALWGHPKLLNFSENWEKQAEKYFRLKMGYKTLLAYSHCCWGLWEALTPWLYVALLLQRLHRGSLQLAAAAALQPFLMTAKSFTWKICDSRCYHTSFEPVSPHLRSFFLWATQVILQLCC